MDIKEILEKIDLSKTIKTYVDFYQMCYQEFDISEYVVQPEDNVKLTYCYYHTWVCTDTQVGIRVWFYEDEPVCISYQPYRKSDETFGWLSKESFDKVRNYAYSLLNTEYKGINIIDDKTISNIVEIYKTIDYKKLERLNIKS